MSIFRDAATGKEEEISPEVMAKAIKRMGNNKARVLLQQPFYGVLLSMIDFIPEIAIETMATDGNKIWFNPRYVNELSDDEVYGVILHEVNHCIYLHCTSKRRMNRSNMRWNYACDFAINIEIHDMDYVLPKGLLDVKYRGMNAEQIYDDLPKDESLLPKLGNPFDMHINNTDESQWDDMEEKIISAYEISKNQKGKGDIPAGIRRWIEKLRRSRVKWSRIFHRYVGQALAKDDYSFTRPNKRLLGQDIYIPDLRNYIIGSVVIAVDTSGSIGSHCLEQFAAEIAKISHLVDEVTAMSCDAAVHEVVKVKKFENFLKKLKMKGGGGTDFRPVFDEVKKRKIVPELLIYLTDAYGTFPEKRPRYPVLWCVTSEDGMSWVPWGQKVLLPNEQGEW